jgi:NADPH:quinone reductase-like Zn-dependent oxidoreductase
MRAITYHRYGAPGVVALAELPKPVPRDNDVLVRIRATTITTADWRARSLEMPAGFNLLGRLVFGIFGPRRPVLGTEFAGVIEAVGRSVSRFHPGDEVFGFPGSGFGCHAEYRIMPEDGMIAPKPGNLSFEQAAALSFGGTTALVFLRDKARVNAGDRVLVVGASGGVGSAAVQIARHLGAEVTAVCSAANAELVRSTGASRTIDYAAEDFAAGNDSWDIILDTTGSAPFARCERVLRPGGRLLVVLASLAQSFARRSRRDGKQVIAGVVTATPANLRYLADLAETSAFTPVIDRLYPLEDAAKAHAVVDTGRKRGNVVLSVGYADGA